MHRGNSKLPSKNHLNNGQELGIYNIKPMQLTTSDIQDRIDKGKDFQDLYEEELREF